MSIRKLTIFAVVWKDLPYVRFSWTTNSFPRNPRERWVRIGSLKNFLNRVATLSKTENKELQAILVSQGSEILTTLKEENVTFVELETFTGTEINQKDIINSLRKHERLYLERNYISLNCGKFKVRIPGKVNTTPKLKKKVNNMPNEEEVKSISLTGPLYLHGDPIHIKVALTDEEILAIAATVDSTPVMPWQLKDDVIVGDIRRQVLSFARAVIEAQDAKSRGRT